MRAPIALDAMGGDYGPEVAVRGAARVVNEGIDLVLVGDKAQLEPIMATLEL
ncbi:Phosphate:acyl-ACP acyltransferase PlsX (EC 2.3.1.n2), partial [hydrothermal vent metagenome]